MGQMISSNRAKARGFEDGETWFDSKGSEYCSALQLHSPK